MRRSLALALILLLAHQCWAQGNAWKKVRYQGGTLETKVDPDEWGNSLRITPDLIQLRLKDGQVVEIEPRTITAISYGQEAHRRVGTMVALSIILLSPEILFGLLHKTRKHYIGIEYTLDGKRSGLLLQAHKDNYRAILHSLKSVSGRQIVSSGTERSEIPFELISTGGQAVQALGVEIDDSENRLRLVSVSPSGTAGRAGLQVGDLLTAVAGVEVRNLAELQRCLDAATGSETRLTVARGGWSFEVKVRL